MTIINDIKREIAVIRQSLNDALIKIDGIEQERDEYLEALEFIADEEAFEKVNICPHEYARTVLMRVRVS